MKRIFISLLLCAGFTISSPVFAGGDEPLKLVAVAQFCDLGLSKETIVVADFFNIGQSEMKDEHGEKLVKGTRMRSVLLTCFRVLPAADGVSPVVCPVDYRGRSKDKTKAKNACRLKM